MTNNYENKPKKNDGAKSFRKRKGLINMSGLKYGKMNDGTGEYQSQENSVSLDLNIITEANGYCKVSIDSTGYGYDDEEATESQKELIQGLIKTFHEIENELKSKFDISDLDSECEKSITRIMTSGLQQTLSDSINKYIKGFDCENEIMTCYDCINVGYTVIEQIKKLAKVFDIKVNDSDTEITLPFINNGIVHEVVFIDDSETGIFSVDIFFNKKDYLYCIKKPDDKLDMIDRVAKCYGMSYEKYRLGDKLYFHLKTHTPQWLRMGICEDLSGIKSMKNNLDIIERKGQYHYFQPIIDAIRPDEERGHEILYTLEFDDLIPSERAYIERRYAKSIKGPEQYKKVVFKYNGDPQKYYGYMK